jgi:hypothetical protein
MSQARRVIWYNATFEPPIAWSVRWSRGRPEGRAQSYCRKCILQLSHRSTQSADILSQRCHERGRRGSHISVSLNPSSTDVIADRRRFYVWTWMAQITQTLLTYSMEQSPSWEANWFAVSQGIPRVLWNPKVHHRTHKRPPPVPILSQPNPVLTPTSHFLKIHPNIIFPSMPRSPQRSLSLRFPHQHPVHTSPFPHTC